MPSALMLLRPVILRLVCLLLGHVEVGCRCPRCRLMGNGPRCNRCSLQLHEWKYGTGHWR